MKKTKTFAFTSIYVFFIILFFSCSEESDRGEIIKESIIIDIDNPVEILFSQLFDTCYFVPLASEAIIGEITQMNFGDKYISVLDSKVSNSLYLFDWKGNLKSKVSAEGEGPGKYIFPQYFSISSGEDKIHIYGNGSKKVLTFGVDGEFQSEFNVSEFGSFQGLKFSNNSFLIGVSESEGGSRFINFSNPEFSTLRSLEIPKQIEELPGNMGKENYFYQEKSGKGFYYQSVFSSDFVNFNSNGVNSHIHFSFSSRGIENIKSKVLLSDYLTKSKDEGFAYLASNHVDAGNLLFLDMVDFGQGALGIYEKSKGKAYKVSRLVNDMSLMLNISAIAGAYNNQSGYLSIAIPYFVFDQIRSQVDFKGNSYEEIIKNVNSEDGETLVLLIYKIKEEINLDL
ncbi:6-bladed beta-propeller protein [Belliella buryatensis]|uniref:6-bladed beta-propeller protein n=1 Tax=Belliella buryatensis TaxID=1500549 RepID=A0A239BEE9_9BACT|nr:6-bladed beta-propeller [Belliella buryatensis]SNS05931.1 6-bladed beta-propeller protein [Belliella buryatensis]